MATLKVFYSWQSDLPNATNRGFIGDALEKACKQIAANPEVEAAPRIDQDTQDLSGAPLIPAAIMQKIDECQVFVADVSLCYTGPKGKHAPNPNVGYELGYAVARLGWDRVVLVVNEEYGKVELLPFDLEKRRAIQYAAREGEGERAEAKKALVGRLSRSIEAIVNLQPIVPKHSPADAAIEAIESVSAGRRAKVREFWSWIMVELRGCAPDFRTTNQSHALEESQLVSILKDALQSTMPILQAWSRICRAISDADDQESADQLVRGFEVLLQEYDIKPGYREPYSSYWFDFYRFLGNEMFTLWIALTLSDQRWKLISGSLVLLPEIRDRN